MKTHSDKTDEHLNQLQQKSKRILELEERCKDAEDALSALVKRNETLGESIPLGIFALDKQGRITGSNSKMNQLLRQPSTDTVKSKSIFKQSILLDDCVVEKIQQCFKQKKVIVTECSHTNQSGETAYLKYHLAPVFENADSVAELIVLVEDITDLKKAEAATKESETQCRLLFQSAPVAMIECDASELKSYIDSIHASRVIDLKGYLKENPQKVLHCWDLIKIVDYNKTFLKLLEAENIEEVSKLFEKGTPDEYLRFAQDVIIMAVSDILWEEREENLTTVKGNRRTVLGKSLIISGHEDTFSRLIITLTDITTLKEAQEALRKSEQRYRQQSLRDNLTGLYNRRYLYNSLSELIETGKIDNTTLSVLFIDLDNFKQVVDTHGHLNGSLAIKEVAATIRECLIAPAFAVSYAGDEFVVVLPAMDNTQANQKALEIRSRISDTDYLTSQGIAAKLSASFGIATFPDHASDLTGLLASSDKALFEAKRSGKNAVRKAEK